MKRTERATGPAIGNSLGYFAALWFIQKVEWLDASDESLAVAAMGTLFIHLIMEARVFFEWASKDKDEISCD